MSADLELAVEFESDPRLIPGIYNYCHGRCERCPFTGRCLTFRLMRADAARHPELALHETIGDSFARTHGLLRDWCERQDVDAPASSGEPRHVDPVRDLAFGYTEAALRLVNALERLAPFHEWSPVLREALETIGWYAGMVSAKVDRALNGLAEQDGLDDEEDPVQNDWNGSAKVARMAIAESQQAWDTLLLVGQAPPDAPLRQTREQLDRIDAELASRFPQAMAFVRPGFDEPKIAAGAAATLTCFEPRPRRRAPHGVAAWLHRIANAWPRRS